jgi:hypothetical protein
VHAASAEDWSVVSTISTGGKPNTLRREIVVFRREGRHFRRSGETHIQRIYGEEELLWILSRAGFAARPFEGLGLPAIVARPLPARQASGPLL